MIDLLGWLKMRLFRSEWERLGCTEAKLQREKELSVAALAALQETEAQYRQALQIVEAERRALATERVEIDTLRMQYAALAEIAKEYQSRMARMEALHVCLQKIHYGSEEAADLAALALWWKEQRLLRSYRCECCGLWCLTSAGGRVPKIVAKNLVEQEVSRRMKTTIGEMLERTNG